ncbi:protein of unknown function [Taphrina deformans PYCC 5710]|uniref:Uncharacterized protein n=1 Tax=Taphrina deformans (strain PYCC 5710 / ATCC 11124 / CBS 356.35 / IMI 108563 / JCM 9778 / NBRC 8474) TaxID=1097556 RepID=R4XI81_TAPDE|nr:protein of unknown function [Taphrina deformans PYCC 5710]|eukprot:CCG84194.1 protein of unknown function [Taphrina deformans PYCC 5710]
MYERDNGESSGSVARFPSNASIQIGLGTSISPALAPSSRAASPLPLPNDHFFSADELLRMSYAESVDGPNSATNKPTRISANDGEAAIMQANNPVLAVRARAAVLQLTKRQSLGSPIVTASAFDNFQAAGQSKRGSENALVVERMSSVGQPRSFWEAESVTSSPIERDLISPDRFEAMNSTTSTKSAAGRSRLSEQDTPTRTDASKRTSNLAELEKDTPPQLSTQLFASAPPSEPRVSGSVDFDWLDPAIFKIA